MPESIAFIDRVPIVSFDGEGVGLVIASGECTWRRRMPRSLFRKFLETSLRLLNEYELAERADRGRIIPMERRDGH